MTRYRKVLFFLLSVAVFTMSLPADGLQSGTVKEKSIKITVLYDNYTAAEGATADWGFACLIEGMEKTILFDTGTRPKILLRNAEQLKVDLSTVDMVVISHDHGDHTGGLFAVLEKKSNIPVYLPGPFPGEFTERVKKAGGKVVTGTSASAKLCENVFLTGVMGEAIKEHALILDTGTDKGLVLITGCSHPGIAGMVRRAGDVLKKKVYMVMGGFHLLRHSEDGVKGIVKEFKQMGVSKCGATHCTGDHAIRVFREAYRENYIAVGTGKILEIRRKKNEG